MKKIRSYFEQNITSYSYLFFAQTLILAERIVITYEKNSIYAKSSISSLAGITGVVDILLLVLLPFLFIFASLVTLKAPGWKSKGNTFYIYGVHSFLILIIIFSALVQQL